MEKPISAGDLVRVVRVCCDRSKLDVIFVVGQIENDERTCWTCNKPSPIPYATGLRGYSGIPIAWLKRIPPLGELEGATDAADKPITLDGEIERLRKMVQA